MDRKEYLYMQVKSTFGRQCCCFINSSKCRLECPSSFYLKVWSNSFINLLNKFLVKNRRLLTFDYKIFVYYNVCRLSFRKGAINITDASFSKYNYSMSQVTWHHFLGFNIYAWTKKIFRLVLGDVHGLLGFFFLNFWCHHWHNNITNWVRIR